MFRKRRLHKRRGVYVCIDRGRPRLVIDWLLLRLGDDLRGFFSSAWDVCFFVGVGGSGVSEWLSILIVFE